MKSTEEKVQELIMLNGEGEDSFIFSEFYSHTDKIMFKINNTFTHYNKDKIVLCGIDEGFEHAVDLAIEEIIKKKGEFFGYNKDEDSEPECSCKAGEPYNNLCCDVHGKMEKL
jgi:hypothetical protein